MKAQNHSSNNATTMNAQQALRTQKFPSLSPSADDLISLTGINEVSKASREHLIELIEKRIDTLQKWHKLATPGGEAQAGIATKLTGLRLKRLEIYNTLHPKVASLIQVGAA
jgi:hypothetical protein